MDSNSINIAQNGANANDLVAAAEKRYNEIRDCLNKIIRSSNESLTQIKSLNTKNAELNAVAHQLKARNDQLIKDKDTFHAENTKLGQEFQNLQNSYNDLNTKYTQQLNANKTLNEENGKDKKLLEDAKEKQVINEKEIRDLQSANDSLTKQKEALQGKIESLEKAIKANASNAAVKQSLPSTLFAADSTSNSVIEKFNSWGRNPNGRGLPDAFYFIEGDLQLRYEQELKRSNTETDWIISKNSAQKYIFPNPRTLDEYTNITKFYKMDLGKLRRKGENRIRVIKPCEISDKGWIGNPGELEII